MTKKKCSDCTFCTKVVSGSATQYHCINQEVMEARGERCLSRGFSMAATARRYNQYCGQSAKYFIGKEEVANDIAVDITADLVTDDIITETLLETVVSNQEVKDIWTRAKPLFPTLIVLSIIGLSLFYFFRT